MSYPIIAVVGSPGTGKSFLVRKLAKHYNAKRILEGEGGRFPKRILNAIVKRDRNMELFLWFRNKLLKEMLLAKRLSEQHTVVTDTFWMANEPYVPIFFKGFEQDVMKDLCFYDNTLLPYPDIVIYLKSSPAKIREFMRERGRSWDTKEFVENSVKMNNINDRVFTKKRLKNLIIIDRSDLDFTKTIDFHTVTSKIDRILANRNL